jgi:dTDP-glucose 4,6-dehydratase
MRRILITGGAGFIGSAAVRFFVEQGWSVRVLDKLTYAGRAENLHGVDADLTVGDVCDTEVVNALVGDVEVVVHLAAESHVTRSIEDPYPFLRTNIFGTQALLDACRYHNIQRFVHVSTDEVFGSTDVPGGLGVDAPLRPGNPYAASKAAAEGLVWAARNTHAVQPIIVRCTNNYGPRQHPEKAVPSWILAAISHGAVPIHGQGDAIRDWLHVEDFARGLGAVVERGVDGTDYHFAGRAARANIEVAEQIIALLGRGRVVHLQDRPGQDMRYALDDRGTRTALDWAPEISFPRGLAQTVSWYREAQAAGRLVGEA